MTETPGAALWPLKTYVELTERSGSSNTRVISYGPFTLVVKDVY
jgi:hypothetical protein